MKTPTDTITHIEKELIETTQFPMQEVLSDSEEIKDRSAKAHKAMILGNSPSNHKVKIVFEDTVSKKIVETTVWGLTDRYLLLKRGMTLPLCRIHEIII